MIEGSKRGGRAYGLSVLAGAFGGVTLQLIVATLAEPVDTSELWAIPVLIVAYGLLALPFVALGLAIFGLPATALFRRYAQKWWLGLVAALLGAVAGKLVFFAIDHFMFFGFYKIGRVVPVDPGLIYGLPTALTWWLLYRRELAGR